MVEQRLPHSLWIAGNPMIAVSAKVLAEQRASSLIAGMKDHAARPFGRARLQAAIERAVEQA